MNNWNLLIVRYLGLDHIGHTSEAFNSFIKDKLAEMDEIIEKIFSIMNKTDLLLITGDYGIADQGAHGASFYVETHVPAVFISHQLKQQYQVKEEYLQIDLTPTLNILFEIPISYNNVGILKDRILKSFYHLNQSNLLKCLFDDVYTELKKYILYTSFLIVLFNTYFLYL